MASRFRGSRQAVISITLVIVSFGFFDMGLLLGCRTTVQEDDKVVSTNISIFTRFARLLELDLKTPSPAHAQFDANEFAKTAEKLNEFESDERKLLLSRFVKDCDEQDKVLTGIILCQCVFGTDGYRSPRLGKPIFVDGKSGGNSIVVRDNLPVLVVKGYAGVGRSESGKSYLKYLIEEKGKRDRGEEDKVLEENKGENKTKVSGQNKGVRNQ